MVANQLKLAAGLFSGNTQLFSIHDALERYSGATRVIVGKDDRIISQDDVDKVPLMLPSIASRVLAITRNSRQPH